MSTSSFGLIVGGSTIAIATVQESFPVLTTRFTPPPACFTNVYQPSESTSIIHSSGIPTYIWAIFPTDRPDCFPNGHTTPTFSPGLCPVDFITASTVLSSDSNASLDRTVATCCPQ